MELGRKDNLSLLNTNIKIFKYIPDRISNYEIEILIKLIRWIKIPDRIKGIILDATGIDELLKDLFYGLLVEQTIGCWYVEDRLNKYRQIYISKKYKDIIAHRLAYDLFIRDIVLKEVCHHCDKAGCCNPWHLFNGTHADNIKDAYLKGRLKRKVTLTQAERFLLWKYLNGIDKRFEVSREAENTNETKYEIFKINDSN